MRFDAAVTRASLAARNETSRMPGASVQPRALLAVLDRAGDTRRRSPLARNVAAARVGSASAPSRRCSTAPGHPSPHTGLGRKSHSRVRRACAPSAGLLHHSHASAQASVAFATSARIRRDERRAIRTEVRSAVTSTTCHPERGTPTPQSPAAPRSVRSIRRGTAARFGAPLPASHARRPAAQTESGHDPQPGPTSVAVGLTGLRARASAAAVRFGLPGGVSHRRQDPTLAVRVSRPEDRPRRRRHYLVTGRRSSRRRAREPPRAPLRRPLARAHDGGHRMPRRARCATGHWKTCESG